MKYHNSLQALEADLAIAPDTKITFLARKIIEGAKITDVAATNNLTIHSGYRVYKNEEDQIGIQIERNFETPFEYTDRSVLGAPTGVSFEKPLTADEVWHEDRRASNTGIKYKFNEHGHPINPFLETGLTGRGLLWQYGPNHAVDNGLLITRPDRLGIPTLYAIGIHRKDNPGVPYISGGFVKSVDVDGKRVVDQEAILISRIEEFFEELVSGSVELSPENQISVQEEYDSEIQIRERKSGESLKQDKKDEIHEQIITAKKMEQVKELDPEFFNRLIEVLEDSNECYAGPVLNSNRATDNAWIETRMFWTHLTEDKWAYIKGENPPFDYALAAGDDADGVHYFEMNGELIDNANASHAPLFAYMAASYLLETQDKGEILHPNIMRQIEDMASYLQAQSAQLSARPEGFTHYKL